ncbi:hypothetical protein VUR80DRAFT_7259 [Thermomyces stellatus]
MDPEAPKDLPSPAIESIRDHGMRPRSVSDQKFSDLVLRYLERDWDEDDAKAIAYLEEFLPANNICDAECKARFDVVTQSEGRRFRQAEIRTHHLLEEYLEKNDFGGSELCILVAENICPYSICRLGESCNIRPKFWATHFEKAHHTQDEEVDPYLPPAPSGPRDFLNVQYIEPRELKNGSEPEPSADTIHVVDCSLEMFRNPDNIDSAHPKPFTSKVKRDVYIFPRRLRRDADASLQVAMVPGPLSAWTTQGGLVRGTDIMVVLIDPIAPRLDVRHNTHLDSKETLKRMWTTSRASTLVETGRPRVPERRVPLRPKQRMAEYLTRSYMEAGLADHPTPYGGIARLIFDQWRLTLGYMRRDVQLIQQRAEERIPDFRVSEALLSDLFVHRQKCAEYSAHIEEAIEELEKSYTAQHSENLETLRKGFADLSAKAEAQVYLLTSLTSIKEAQQGLEENRGVTRLSQIATIYLPFSTVAAVLAMPDKYSPGEGRFWTYWVASIVLAVVVTSVVVNYEWLRVRCVTWTQYPLRAGVNKVRGQRGQGGARVVESVHSCSMDDLEGQKGLEVSEISRGLGRDPLFRS